MVIAIANASRASSSAARPRSSDSSRGAGGARLWVRRVCSRSKPCRELSGRPRRALREQFHRERLAVPGIDRSYLQAFQDREAGSRGRGIIHQGIEGRPFRVLKEIAAEQLAGGSQNAYGPLGMPRQTDDLRLEAVLREVVSIIEENVGRESLGLPKPREERDQGADEDVRFLSVHEHIPAFGHAGIVTVHRDPGSESGAEVGRVPDMVEVPMREQHELERTRRAAGAF